MFGLVSPLFEMGGRSGRFYFFARNWMSWLLLGGNYTHVQKRDDDRHSLRYSEPTQERWHSLSSPLAAVWRSLLPHYCDDWHSSHISSPKETRHSSSRVRLSYWNCFSMFARLRGAESEKSTMFQVFMANFTFRFDNISHIRIVLIKRLWCLIKFICSHT